MSDSKALGDPNDSRLDLWIFSAATLLFYALTARGYGYFRDELYYLANGEHLGFGYVEHPPFVGLVAAFVRATLGDSLLAIRLPSALAAAATVWVVGAMARDFGGGRFARTLAMFAAFATPVYLSVFTVFSMNAFDILFWALGWWLLVRILGGRQEDHSGRLWLAFGLVAGVGLENKISVLFLGFGLVVGLVVSRRWEVFRSRWIWLGGALAGLLFLPHVLWQVANDWPTLEFMDNARRLKNVALAPFEFVVAQAMMLGPLPLLVLLAGLVFLLIDRRTRAWRALGWAGPAILALMLAMGGAKPYYLSPAYTVFLAAGGVAIATWSASWRFATPARALLLIAGIPLSLAIAPLAKPLLPVETYVRYADALGMTPRQEENNRLGRLPQFLADMHGWPELAAIVTEVYKQLPPEEQAKACFFGQNYGEAGAVDILGSHLGGPKAISSHNSYWLWGPRGCTAEVLLVIGDDRERLDELFESVELGATFHCQDCMPYEDGRSIWIARGLRGSIAELWPQIKSYI